MNLQTYLLEKERRAAAIKGPRPKCERCRRPLVGCYCPKIQAFTPDPLFVILIHRHEARRSIATGRMAHLCLPNSLLLEGSNYTHNTKVNALLADPECYPVVLYPTRNATDVSSLSPEGRRAIFPPGKRLVIFIIDATWAQAKRVRRYSKNLAHLPTIRFTPSTPSTFRVRHQPTPECYSTIEAIHWLLDSMYPENQTAHKNLLDVFGHMVEQQIHYESTLHISRRRWRPHSS